MGVWDAWMVDNHQMSPSDPDCQLLTKTNCPNHYRHPLLDESTIDTFLASKQRVRTNILLQAPFTGRVYGRYIPSFQAEGKNKHILLQAPFTGRVYGRYIPR